MSSDTAKPDMVGQPAGRFCPTCRSPMLYTGSTRETEVGPSTEERCSTCGFTAWKRALTSTDEPARK